MAKTVVYSWNVMLDEEEKELIFKLNDGINKIFPIEHSSFKGNLSNVLLEILHYQFYIGTKTEVNPDATLLIQKANDIHDIWLKSENL